MTKTKSASADRWFEEAQKWAENGQYNRAQQCLEAARLALDFEHLVQKLARA